MTPASNSGGISRMAVLFCLEPSLASSLEYELARCGWQAQRTDAVLEGGDPPKADIVFCPSSRAMLRQAMGLFPNTPVVVVSRLPEVDGWLDALEEGAADYCAPPFETVQVRWLLDTHTAGRQAVAAA